VIDSQREVPEAIDHRKRHNRPELANDGVGQDGAEQRQKVYGRDERVIPGVGLVFGHEIRLPAGVEQGGGHENDQDRIQAVVAKAFGRFAANDVRHARRHPVRLNRRG
jgi:hypothetical protein